MPLFKQGFVSINVYPCFQGFQKYFLSLCCGVDIYFFPCDLFLSHVSPSGYVKLCVCMWCVCVCVWEGGGSDGCSVHPLHARQALQRRNFSNKNNSNMATSETTHRHLMVLLLSLYMAYHRGNTPVTQTNPVPTLLSLGGWQREHLEAHQAINRSKYRFFPRRCSPRGISIHMHNFQDSFCYQVILSGWATPLPINRASSRWNSKQSS